MTVTDSTTFGTPGYAGGMSAVDLDPEPVALDSESDAVLADMRRAFGRILATLGVRRPIELQRKLKLDAKMSWQICKVAGVSSKQASASSIPSRAALTRFVNTAAEAGVAAGELQALAGVYDRFERLVERHAGDRASFNSLITTSAGLSKEWLATDLQHRRNMFRGECHVMGVHARTRVVTAILEPDAQGGVRFLSLSGYVGLRVLREMDDIRLHGCHMRKGDADAAMPAIRHRAVTAAAPGGFMLEAFCSRPLSATRVLQGGNKDTSWISTLLVRPKVGNLGLTTVMFGEYYLLDALPETVGAFVTIPQEVLMIDVLVAPGILTGPPRPRVFRGSDMSPSNPGDEPPDIVPLFGSYDLQSLGHGTSDLATADVSQYPEFVRAAAQDLAGDIETFSTWRFRLEYPVYHSTCRLELPCDRGRPAGVATPDAGGNAAAPAGSAVRE